MAQYSTSTNHRQPRLQTLDLPVFPHPCLYAGDFNCRHADWVTMTTVRTVNVWLTGQVLIVLPSYIMPRTLPVFIPAAGTLAPIQTLLLLAQVQTVAYRIDVSLISSPGHNIDLRLSHHQGLLWRCQACLLSDGTIARPNGVTTLL